MRWMRRALLGALVAGLWSAACSDDVEPQGDYKIVIRTFSFFQDSIVVSVGSTVEWVNVNPRDSVRTVTSGTGPEDSTAGALFDRSLRGYPSGEPEGEKFFYTFGERGRFPYFSRLPAGQEFTGVVEVQ